MVKEIDYHLIVVELYKLGEDEILRRCILKNETKDIIKEVKKGTIGGHYARKVTMHKIMHAKLWYPTIVRDMKEYYEAYDVCERVRKPSRRDEMSLNPQLALQPFYKWPINFIRPINTPPWRLGARYIIIDIDY